MFRLHRTKSSFDKTGEKFDFIFSNFQALQVPKGWDKLHVSIVSVATGKAITRSGKAAVHNGTCRWTETLSASFCILEDDGIQEHEQHPCKFVVAMGSSRIGILGEATIDLAKYRNLNSIIPVSLPLKKCSHGTNLQVEIKCPLTKRKLRDEKGDRTRTDIEGGAPDKAIENILENSDITFTGITGSTSNDIFGSRSRLSETESAGTSSLVSDFHCSTESMEYSLRRDNSRDNPVGDDVVGSGGSRVFRSQENWLYNSSNGASESNKSFNDEAILGPGMHLQDQKEGVQHSSKSTYLQSMNDAPSTEAFQESQSFTEEELKAEARLWKQTARKLKLDLEMLRNEFSDQSRQLEILHEELCSSKKECDGLMQKVNHLSETKEKATEMLEIEAKKLDTVHRELSNELRFQRESNDFLSSQLKKTQESNIELVSILQEMEETIEKQKMEIEKLLIDNKSEVTGSTNIHENNHLELKENSRKLFFPNSESALKQKVENQIQPFQESKEELRNSVIDHEPSLPNKDYRREEEQDKIHNLLDLDAQWKLKLAEKETEIIFLKAELAKATTSQDSAVDETSSIFILDSVKEIEHLKKKVEELERDCNELTDENLDLLLKLKESSSAPSNNTVCFSSFEDPATGASGACISYLTRQESAEWLSKEERQEAEYSSARITSNDLQHHPINVKTKGIRSDAELKVPDQQYHLNASTSKHHNVPKEIVIEGKQKELEHSHEEQITEKEKNFCLNLGSSEPETLTDASKLTAQLHQLLQFYQSNLEKQDCVLHTESGSNNATIPLQKRCASTQEDLARDVKNELCRLLKNQLTAFEDETEFIKDDKGIEVKDIYEVHSKSEHGSSKENFCFCCSELLRSNEELKTKVENLNGEILAKTSEVMWLKADCSNKQEEIQQLRNYKSQQETQIALGDDIKHSVDAMEEQRDLTAVSTLSESPTKSREMLSFNTKSFDLRVEELESDKQELEKQLDKIEDDNIHLSERISGLEAQLRYLTDAREMSRLELHHSESCVMNLQDEILRLESEIESQKVKWKQSLQEMHNKWLEAQEDCEYLKRANLKLEVTAENLIDECNLLQKTNGELKKKVEFHKHCKESRLKKHQDFQFHNANNSGIEDGNTLKEELWGSEVDGTEECLLNQMHLEKAYEVGNLKREEAEPVKKVNPPYYPGKQQASESFLQQRNISSDKVNLHMIVQEAEGNLDVPEEKVDHVPNEQEARLEDLMVELCASKQNYENLEADYAKLLRLMKIVRCSEANLKCSLEEMESEKGIAEQSKQEQAEEVAILKAQLQRVQPLQDEIINLKDSLTEMKYKNERLEASLQLARGDYKDLMSERTLISEKMSSLQKEVAALEKCKLDKIALQEKILRLEGDLTAREASSSLEAELKTELGRIQRAVIQYQWKVKNLEVEKEYYQEKLRSHEILQEERDDKTLRAEPNSIHLDLHSDANLSHINHQHLECSKVQTEEAYDGGSLQESLFDYPPRTQLPVDETPKTLEINGMHNEKLDISWVREHVSEAEDQIRFGTKNSPTNADEKAMMISVLEAELQEIHERYLLLSLKYAEVETEREQLAMTLKALNHQKKPTT